MLPNRRPISRPRKANTHANGRTKSAAISTDWWRLPRRKWTSGAAALKAARRERNRSPLRQVKNALRSATRPNPTTRRGKSAKKRRSRSIGRAGQEPHRQVEQGQGEGEGEGK